MSTSGEELFEDAREALSPDRSSGDVHHDGGVARVQTLDTIDSRGERPAEVDDYSYDEIVVEDSVALSETTESALIEPKADAMNALMDSLGHCRKRSDGRISIHIDQAPVIQYLAASAASRPPPKGKEEGKDEDVFGTPGGDEAFQSPSAALGDFDMDDDIMPDEDFVLMVKDLDTGKEVKFEEVDSMATVMGLCYPREPPPASATLDDEDRAKAESDAAAAREKQKKKRSWFGKKGKASTTSSDDESAPNFVEVTAVKKSRTEFTNLHRVQELAHHEGAVWSMRFSADGRYLASGGQDSVVRVWGVRSEDPSAAGVSPSGELGDPVFEQDPIREYRSHTAAIFDLAWSRSNFLLSSSRDKTVRLWHVSRAAVLAVFQHPDLVTAVVFHPISDEVFITASFDKRVRLWNIREQRVVSDQETPALITACNITNDGGKVLCGMLDGHLLIYDIVNQDGLSLQKLTTIHVRSTRGKNSKGKKITGVELSPDGNRVLVTTNDSRIRLYNLNDYSLQCKYRGLVNEQSRIKATFSELGDYIICGSENQHTYIYKTANDNVQSSMFSSQRKDRANSYEYFTVHEADNVTLCALFAPSPVTGLVFNPAGPEPAEGQVMVTVSFDGIIVVCRNLPL